MLDKKIKIFFSALILFFAPSFFLHGEGIVNFDGTLALEEKTGLVKRTAALEGTVPDFDGTFASVGTGQIFERTLASVGTDQIFERTFASEEKTGLVKRTDALEETVPDFERTFASEGTGQIFEKTLPLEGSAADFDGTFTSVGTGQIFERTFASEGTDQTFEKTLALEEKTGLVKRTAALEGTAPDFERTFALEGSAPQTVKAAGKDQDITFENSQNNFFWNKATVWDYTFSLAEVLAINTFVKEFAIIALGQDWIETSRQTVKTSLTNPWIWDNSSFRKNQIFHAYFGNMYFTSARSNGMGFLQSLLFTGAGSFCWETFQEAGNISLNDFLTTTFAGAVLGEQLFRLSQAAYSLNKPLSFLISPVAFFNNAVRQKNYQDTSSDIYSMDFCLGAGSLFSRNQSLKNLNSESQSFQKDEVNAFADFSLDIIYKNPFGHTSKELMDQFETYISLSKDFSGYNFKANFDSTIFSVATGDGIKKDGTLGISYNYDITYASRYWLSKNSAGIFFREKINLQKSNLAWGLEGDFIFLGVTDNNLETNENLLKPKTYTYTNGPELKFFATYQNEVAGDFSLKADVFYLFSYSESGQTLLPDGNFFVLEAAASYSHKIFSNFSLGLSLEYFTKIQTASKNTNSSLNENEFSVSAFAKYSL